MVDTVVLVTVKVGAAERVAAALENLSEIEKVLIVTGPYDVVALAEIPEKKDYRRFVNAIHEIEGITRTETCMGI
ncbi:MAG: Lrp/AsnC ligand binding domain-containing protein [Candidatus Thorarchaeota archaeon]